MLTMNINMFPHKIKAHTFYTHNLIKSYTYNWSISEIKAVVVWVIQIKLLSFCTHFFLFPNSISLVICGRINFSLNFSCRYSETTAHQSTPLIAQLHWVQFRINVKLILHILKALCGFGCTIYRNLLNLWYFAFKSLRSSSQQLLKVPSSHLKT